MTANDRKPAPKTSTKPAAEREWKDADTGRDPSKLDDRDDEGEPRRMSSAGASYAGDHKNHGEEDIDDIDLLEEIELDEMPDFEGPDA